MQIALRDTQSVPRSAATGCVFPYPIGTKGPNAMRVFAVALFSGALLVPALAQNRGNAQWGGVPSVSVRRGDGDRIRGAVPATLGWRIGARSTAFGASSFHDAAARVDAAGFGFIEGSAAHLDYHLAPDEITRVKNRLNELRLRMISYHIDSIPSDDGARRRLFGFLKEMGVETVVSAPDSQSLDHLDKLAAEFGINVAFTARDPKALAKLLEGRGMRLGAQVDLKDPRPLEALSVLRTRVIAANLRGVNPRPATTAFLLELSKLQPPDAPPFPYPCGDCAAPRVPVKPVILTFDTAGASDPVVAARAAHDAYDDAVRPAMGWRINEISRKTPTTPTSLVPPEHRSAIEAGLPRKAPAAPKKPRKLLVIDLSPQGGYYHKTVAHANLAIELLAKYTRAFEPVFNNDLDNLKYPKIRQYDAVFLNSVVGDVFADPDVLNGLLRFVREGGGVAGIHGTTYASTNLPEFGEMMGGQTGPHRIEKATLKIDDPSSPLTKSFGGKDFVYTDEYYHFLPDGPYSREKQRVLLSIKVDDEHLKNWQVRPDNDYGLSWIKSYGKGRVFNCAMGHTPTFFSTAPLAEHFLAGIQFVLGDLEADTTPSARASTGNRMRNSAMQLLGWRLGLRSTAFGNIPFAEAAAKTAALGIQFIEGSSANLSPATPVAEVKAILDRYRLKMPAYRAETVSVDSGNISAFTKALGVENATTYHLKEPGMAQFLLELSRKQPPEAPEWPLKCGDCATPRPSTVPLFFTIDPQDIALYDKAVRPAMGWRVNEIARKFPITTPEKIPAAERAAIEAAIPAQPAAKPKKRRKLLIIDACPAGGFYHHTAAHGNLMLDLLGKKTGAYEPVFSNDLENLRYPKIKQFDAVFLNSTVGPLFADPEVMEGLLRYVREGGGVAGLHGATYASQDVPEYGELMGARSGPHQYNGEPGTLKIDDPNSPITKHFGGKGFSMVDEFYHFPMDAPYSREKLHILLSLDADQSDVARWERIRPDRDFGTAWVRAYGKGRVFNTSLGHRPEFYGNPDLVKMVLGGIQFVLGDLETDTTPSAKLAQKGVK
jgi:type 1 glutamine amidotransferase/sugar phosphate isomerase/epimerase